MTIFRKMEECYEGTVHPQKRMEIKKILDIVMVRVVELKHQLVKWNEPNPDVKDPGIPFSWEVFTLSLSHIYIYIHIISLIISHTHTYSLSFSLIISLTHFLSHSLSIYLSFFLSLSHTHSILTWTKFYLIWNFLLRHWKYLYLVTLERNGLRYLRKEII